jgi:hypothetical protein
MSHVTNVNVRVLMIYCQTAGRALASTSVATKLLNRDNANFTNWSINIGKIAGTDMLRKIQKNPDASCRRILISQNYIKTLKIFIRYPNFQADNQSDFMGQTNIQSPRCIYLTCTACQHFVAHRMCHPRSSYWYGFGLLHLEEIVRKSHWIIWALIDWQWFYRPRIIRDYHLYKAWIKLNWDIANNIRSWNLLICAIRITMWNFES